MDIIIFEDDLDFANKLEVFITDNFKSAETIVYPGNLNELTKYVNKMRTPALFILDIVIGNKNFGFNVANQILESKIQSPIVFVTDYPKKILLNSIYKINSYNVILKKSPCFDDEIKITIESALKNLLLDKCFVYQDKYTWLSLDILGIIYIESVKGKKRVRIFHENGIYMLNVRMNDIITKLGEGFCRCHNSYIVNLRKITEVNRTERKITMNNGGICYYSQIKGNEILNYMKGMDNEIT